jgi:lysophospholipase L1-like esterase
MSIRQKFSLIKYASIIRPINFILFILAVVEACTIDYPAQVATPNSVDNKPKSDTICSCTATSPISTSSTPASSTTASSGNPTAQADSLNVPPPRFSPDGGRFHVSTAVRLIPDTLPPQAIVEFSIDQGKSWQSGQQFTVTSGGIVLARLRAGDKVSRSRAATFNLYFERMLVIGNSIMSHGPAPDIGWINFNGMAASAPEKDFVHLLTAYLQTLSASVTVKMQSGGNFENSYGTSAYNTDEFNETLQQFKPDLIIVRIGENIDDGQVGKRNLTLQFRLLLERLASYNQPVKIVSTTSVWDRPQADAVIRQVVREKNYHLVDLSSMVGKGQYFASQYANPTVAAHPNDAGMKRIADLIWEKVQ